MLIAKLPLAAAVAATLLLTACQTTDMQMGSQGAKTVATGAAAGDATANASSSLEKCPTPLGTAWTLAAGTPTWVVA